MVFVASFVGAVTLLAGFAAGLPRPDSAVGQEVAVSAPNGIILSDTAELASQSAAEAASSASWYPAATTTPSYATATPYAAPPPSYDQGYSSMGYNNNQYNSGYASPSYGYAASSAYASASVSSYSPPPAYTSPPPSYTTPSYGSGSSNWNNYDGYNACVQQCVASFGAPPAMYTPPPSMTTDSSSSGSSGNGVTHTVIVAPTQGVLRYVPFAVNASVGDTVHFVWNANNHTVTKSSELELCNKTSDAPFASGTHDMGFTFDQVVNDTNPTFFYCGTPGHCQKGMFGIINPPSVANAQTSVALQMSNLTSSSPDLNAMATYVNSQTVGNLQASTWGQNIDLAGLPDWSHEFVAENVLYVRNFIAQNPDVLNEDGSINMNTNSPLMFPTTLLGSTNGTAASSSASTTPTGSTPVSSASTTPSSAAASGGNTSGAGRTAVSGGLLAITVIAASLLAL